MLLQRLCDYADRELARDAPPAGYQNSAVRYLFRLDSEGRLLGPPIDTSDPSNRSTKGGTRRLVPSRKITSGIRPKLLCHDSEYAFGLARNETRDTNLVARRASAFLKQAHDCADATDEPSVRAVVRFLEHVRQDGAALLRLPVDFDLAATLTFTVDGMAPIDSPSVRQWWAMNRGAGETAGTRPRKKPGTRGTAQPCIVCGTVGPALPMHPFTIKGIPGGQQGGENLISAYEASYESYGLKKSTIAPTCAVCAEKYLNALNALLADKATRLVGKQEVHVFWTAVGPAEWVPGALNAVSSEDVREMLRAPRTGKWAALDLDQTAFYALGLGANGSRAVVRSWLDSTVGEVLRHLERWFRLQRMVFRDGQEGRPLPVRVLVDATVRDPAKNKPPASLADDLLALALQGRPLPADTLAVAVRRCRAEQGVSHPLAVLIKLALGSQVRPGPSSDIPEEIDRMSALDPESRDPAYVCGRQLAVLEVIQRRAIGPNATLVDRFYGSASSAPASVYGMLHRNAQNHLSKLKKDPRTRGTGIALDQRLTEVMDLLREYPKTLSLPEQANFALGYYHQQAADRRAAAEAKARREAIRAAGETPTENDEDDEDEAV